MARIEKLEYISGSSIQDYMDDRWRWCLKWVENRVPRSVPTALQLGKLVHAAFEMHFKNPSLPVHVALSSLLPPMESLLDLHEQKAVDAARGLIEPLAFWQEQFPITATLAVEEPFEFYLTSGAKFRGRPDREVLAYQKAFHMQHKTIGGSVRPATYVLLMMESLHELLYGLHLKRKYAKQGIEYGGTILNAVRKLKYRSKQVTKAEPLGKILHQPSEIFFQQAIPIDEKSMLAAFDEVNELSIHMDRTMDMYLNDKLIPRNRRLDGGRHGNSVDPYLLVATGEISLADDLYFMDREETYDETVEVELDD